MLTIFTCPKPFTDPHIATIQRNAIRSWTLLEPRPQIVLFGDEEGVAETAREFGAGRRPAVQRNPAGVPLLSDVFDQAQGYASSPLLAYVNCDIILMSDFAAAVSQASRIKRRFMMGGRPWDVAITEVLSFEPGWEDRLRQQVRGNGRLRGMNACDYFVFPRGMWGEIPPLAAGRPYFDNHLMCRCRRSGGNLIDATSEVMAIHQSHSYGAHSQISYMDSAEARRNYQLAGGAPGLCSWWHATHRLTPHGLKRDWRGWLRYWYPDAILGTPWHRKEFESGPK